MPEKSNLALGRLAALLLLVACGEPGARPGHVARTRDTLLRADFDAKLMADDAQSGSYLGSESVSLDGDYAVLGAPTHYETTFGTGTAYVAAHTAQGWGALDKLVRDDPDTDQAFGHSTALHGDTAVIGAPHDSTVASNSGAAYVFRRNASGAWAQEDKLLGSEIALVSNFGRGVALHQHTLFVGASEPILGNGSVYVFSRSGSTWTELDRLTANDGTVDDNFGQAVATDGTTLVVGAPLDDEDGDGSGSAYLFALENGVWTEKDKLVAPSGAALELFGISVGVDGNTLAVGAQGRLRGTTAYGAVFVFERTTARFEYKVELSPSALTAESRFGRRLALRADTLAVGAPYDQDSATSTYAGAAYLYRREGSTWGEPLHVIAPGGPIDAQTFGSAIAIGASRLLVGAGQDSEAAPVAGAGYVFAVSDGGQGGQAGADGQGGQAGGAGAGGTAGSSSGGGGATGEGGEGGVPSTAGAGGDDTGGTGGSAVSGGRGGDATSGGSSGTGRGGSAGSSAGQTGDAGDGGSTKPNSSDDSGCGCRVGQTGKGSGVSGLLLLLGATLLVRKGRRRRAFDATALVALCTAGCVGTSASGPPTPEGGSTPPSSQPKASISLREAALPTKRKVGVAVATWFMGAPAYSAVAAREFDSLTAENEMKWYATEPSPGKFTFEAGDRLVEFSEKHSMRVRGHTLVWHNQLAPWVKDLAPKELKAAMLRHVRETAGHWKGRIAQWDVVNEAVDDAGKLRDNSPFTVLGPGYLADAFRAAHEADPQALLFYNDYDVEAPDSPKTRGAYELVKSLKESGVPIHGMGFQMHVDPRNWPSSEAMQETLERFAKLDLLIELTEIDVPVGEIPGSREEKLEKQSELYRGVVRACLAVPACTGMTFWGLTDENSWLSTDEWGPKKGRGPHLPLLFDESYRAKPAHDGVVRALAGR